MGKRPRGEHPAGEEGMEEYPAPAGAKGMEEYPAAERMVKRPRAEHPEGEGMEERPEGERMEERPAVERMTKRPRAELPEGEGMEERLEGERMPKRPRTEPPAGERMAMRPRVGRWDDQENMSLIFGILHSYADHARASAVCRDWYAVAVQSSPRTPMLRFPPTAAAFVAEYVWVSPVCCIWRPAASHQPPPLPAPTPSSTVSLIPSSSRSLQPLCIASHQPPPLPAPTPSSTVSLIRTSSRSLQPLSVASLTPPIRTNPTPTASPPLLASPSTVPLPFLCPFGLGKRNLNGFPEEARTARFCGSFPGGWAALALDRWRAPSLHNIISGDRVDLPNVIHSPAPAVDCAVAIKCLVLSAAPTTPDGSYVITAMTSGVSNVAFWCPGMNRWWPPTPVANNGLWRTMLPRDPVVDLIYFRGRLHAGFYVLNSKEQLAAYVEEDLADDDDDEADDDDDVNEDDDGDDVEDNHLTWRVMTYNFESGRPCDSERVSARYLVESEGELVMVRHLKSPEDFEFFALEEISMEVGDTIVARWRKCPVLGGRALFLGRGCSRSLESGNPSSVVVHCPCSSEDTDWLYL